MNRYKTMNIKVQGKFIEEIDSTMYYLKDYHLVNENEVFYIVAERQFSGKGRKNRTWFSPIGGLYMTIIKKPFFSPLYYQALSALTVAEVIKDIYGYRAKVKWLNDIYTYDYTKKIGGILIEYQEKNNEGRIGIGIGVNINNSIPKELSYKATSLYELTGKKVPIQEIACRIVFKLLENEVILNYPEDITLEYKKWVAMNKLKVRVVETGKIVIVRDIKSNLELEVVDPSNNNIYRLKDETIEIIGKQ